MTFREFMLENGYELQTTFWNDFSIADRFGLSAVQDTSNRALQKALENPEVKNAIMDVIESSIEEILANQKKVEL